MLKNRRLVNKNGDRIVLLSKSCLLLIENGVEHKHFYTTQGKTIKVMYEIVTEESEKEE